VFNVGPTLKLLFVHVWCVYVYIVGKTTTVVELIRQFVARGLRVLACAPSNLAVDNLVEKLGERLPVRSGKQTHDMSMAVAGMASGSNIPVSSTAAFDAALAANTAAASTLQSNRGYDIRLCRLGHPARIIPSVLKYTLDSVVASSDAEAVCAGIRSDMQSLNKAVDKSKDRSERNSMRREVRELQRALRERERRAITESLQSTEVLCCTLVNAASKLMDQFGGDNSTSNSRGFDVVVIDEAAQALEVACLLPLIKGRKLILAGDNKQLGPTVKSKEACAGGLEYTLFDRLHAKPYGQRITTMLIEQYRMHQTIMKWSSDELYGGKLIVCQMHI
jgi:superfamily I DNA and/or RNA helicase